MPDLVRLIERQYLDPDHKIDRWVQRFLKPGRKTDTGQLLMTMTYAIKEGFTYTHRHERGTQDPVTTLRHSKGTCRDFAVLMIEAVRSLGLAARFVSGYLHVPTPDRRATITSAAATRMPGARFTCRAPAGSSSIRPTASWATAT